MQGGHFILLLTAIATIRLKNVTPQFFIDRHPRFDEQREGIAHECFCIVSALGKTWYALAREVNLTTCRLQVIWGSLDLDALTLFFLAKSSPT